MACSIAPSPLSQFELDRLNRIAENRRRMEECGLLETAKNLQKAIKTATAISKPAIKRTPKERRRKTRHQPVRRSGRLNGSAAEFDGIDGDDCCTGVTYSDYEPGLKDLLAGDAEIESLPEEKQVQFQEMRCAAAGRGSMYDSVAGITCHFCRQKKLCGEDNCPRCSRRSTTAECIGKSDCSRCHSATGRFCRACLLIRYGQNLEEVREQMAAGTWLCPHCYEEEHPEEGWMCNSSICMKRRGFKPTGIAIYDAQQRGFPSVAHWLQAQLLKNSNTAAGAATAPAAAAPATTKPVSSSGSNVSSEGEAEVATAGTAAAAASKPAAGKKGVAAAGRKKGAAAAAAESGLLSSQESCHDDAAVAAVAAAVAPGTPQKAFEAPTPGPAVAEEGAAVRRSTRAAAAAVAGGVASKLAAAAKAAAAAVMVAAVPAGKRACVGEAGTRKSLRFKH